MAEPIDRAYVSIRVFVAGVGMSWKRRFDGPIVLPDGRRLITLQDAGAYITKLPKAEHEAPEWQATMEVLNLVATLGGPTMFARIGVMRALNRRVERVFDTSRKDMRDTLAPLIVDPMPSYVALKTAVIDRVVQ
jgi:hypothetical protein